MKKIRLLQISVYIAAAAFFLQDAGAGAYKGFMEGSGLSIVYNKKTGSPTFLIPSVCITGASFSNFKNDELKLNDNLSLENININADIRVNEDGAKRPLWVLAFKGLLVCGILYLLLKIAWIVNNIIYNIYKGTVFRSEAVKLMRNMGILLVLYFVADYIFQQLLYLENNLIKVPLKLMNTSSFNFEALICGLLALIIADAFKEAALLKEEQELTI